MGNSQKNYNGNGYIVVAEFKNLIMNIEREIKVRDAIKYCIENFDSKTATNRIVEFWKDELKLQEQAINYSCCCKSKRPNTSSTLECFTKSEKNKNGNNTNRE